MANDLGNKKYYCNPINMEYLYQFTIDRRKGEKTEISREAADPSLILYKGKYYLCASMTLGVWVSEDMVTWENHRLPDSLPLYDYAPDIRVIGDYVYFCASNSERNCDYYRTKDVINGPYEKVPGTFPFWDPNLFQDDDGRIYFYWGCSNSSPIWGVELNKEDMKPIGEKKALILGNVKENGFERTGEDHSLRPLEGEELEQAYHAFLEQQKLSETDITPEIAAQIKGIFNNFPYIEGAWMTKKNGRYYLQYACPGTEYNVYGDGVYVSENPLGPFQLAENNPYSYKPGGFITGAGHGSTMQDRYGNWWHTATMRISKNQSFERRVGLWPAGFDSDGELFCNQNYGDWPRSVEQMQMDPWADPEWYLLSYNKPVTASSFEPGKEPALAANEDIRTWWRAESSAPGEWLLMDLEEICSVYAIQIDFADDTINIPVPGEIHSGPQPRYIDEQHHRTRWILEYSTDGKEYHMLEDKSGADTDLPHDFLVYEQGIKIRFLKLTILEIPFGQKPCISGLRVFGKGNGQKPEAAEFDVKQESDLDMTVKISCKDKTGYNILWGYEKDKLYHSYLTYSKEQRIGALVKDRPLFMRVDSFNENGITHGKVKKIK